MLGGYIVNESKPVKIIAVIMAAVVVFLMVLLVVHHKRNSDDINNEDYYLEETGTTVSPDNNFLTEIITTQYENTELTLESVTTSVNVEQTNIERTTREKTQTTANYTRPSTTVIKTTAPELLYIDIYSYPYETSYYVGDSFSSSGLKIVAHYSNGSNQDVTSNATLSKPNMYTAGTQSVNIKYKDEKSGVSKSVSYTIDIIMPSIEISKSKLYLLVDESYLLTSYTQPAGISVKWKSAASSIASVSSKGKVVGVDNGKTTITASFTYNGITYTSDSCLVEVEREKETVTYVESNIYVNDVNWDSYDYNDTTAYIYAMSGYVASNYDIDYVVIGLKGPVYINGKKDMLNQTYSFNEEEITGAYFSLDPQNTLGSGEYYDFDIIPGEKYEFYIMASDVGGGWYEDYWTIEF